MEFLGGILGWNSWVDFWLEFVGRILGGIPRWRNSLVALLDGIPGSVEFLVEFLLEFLGGIPGWHSWVEILGGIPRILGEILGVILGWLWLWLWLWWLWLFLLLLLLLLWWWWWWW